MFTKPEKVENLSGSGRSCQVSGKRSLRIIFRFIRIATSQHTFIMAARSSRRNHSFLLRSSGSLPKACRQPRNSTGAQPEYLQKNTNIANYCLLFSLFNCNFNQNIYYRAQITLTLKNFHKQIIYTYKRFKKHICTTKCLFLHIIFICRQRIKMEHRFFDSRPLQ